MLANKLNLHEATSELIRVGPKCDGGYVLPRGVLAQSGTLVSLGVGFDLRFEHDYVKKTGGQVCVIDRNIDITNYITSELKGIRTFYRAFKNFIYLKTHRQIVTINKYISNQQNEEDFSFLEFLEMMQKTRNSILKIDIERYEYTLFTKENINRMGDLQINCIIIEFHGLKDYHSRLCEIIEDFKKINLYLVHVHGNNYTPFYNDLGMYNCSEFTFVNEKFCLPTKIINKQLPIHLLDYPANKNRVDIKYAL